MRLLFRLNTCSRPLAWHITHEADGLVAESEAGSLFIDPGAAYRICRRDRTILVHDGRLSDTSEEECRDPGGSHLRIELTRYGTRIRSDRIGTIHLYLRHCGNRVTLGSSLCDVADNADPELDELGGLASILMGHPIGTRTLLKDITLLPPAVTLRWDVGSGPAWERHWRPHPVPAAPTAKSSDFLDRFIDALGEAQSRSTSNASAIAYPVTGGLDSRINLALGRFRSDRDMLYTVHSPGDPEVAIARRIARGFGVGLHEVPYDHARWWRFLDADLRNAEMSRGQAWLSPTGQYLSALQTNVTILDGYLQDAWFNPRLVSDSEEGGLHRALLRFARHRWQHATGSPRSSMLNSLAEDVEDHYRALGRAGLEANQRFYLENRSRRMVFDTVRVASRSASIALPGMDHALMDFALALPWNLRSGGTLYREAILQLSPSLACVPYDKTGLPLTSSRQYSWSLVARTRMNRILNRLWRDRPFLRGAEPHLLVGLRRDPEFRAAVAERIDASEWVEHLLQTRRPGTSLAKRATTQQALVPVVLGALTVADLELLLRQPRHRRCRHRDR